MQKFLKQFICVRLVKMQEINLQQFQFDYDLTWAGLCLHSDGTVLARYGSRRAESEPATNTIAGLMFTLQQALDAYQKYPANKEFFVQKQGPQLKHPEVNKLPSEIISKRLGEVSRKNCIHCHNIYDAQHDIAAKEGTYSPFKVWKYPFPENIGLQLNPKAGNQISEVKPKSFAEKAGLKSGDIIRSLNQQPIYSIADVQFVLHHLPPENAMLQAVVDRDKKSLTKEMLLPKDWKVSDISWRGSMWHMPPSPGLWTVALTENEKRKKSLPQDRVSLLIRGVFRPEVKKAGLQKGDVIVAYDGKQEPVTAKEFAVYLRFNHYQPGSKLTLTILRNGKEKDYTVTF